MQRALDRRVTVIEVEVFLLLSLLPASAWLVSFSGDYRIALLRDFFLLLLAITGVLSFFKGSFFLKNRPFIYLISFYLFWLVMSYFWREESFSQWLRGVRYLGEPALLLVIASLIGSKYKFPYRSFVYILLAVVMLGYVEWFFPSIFRYSLEGFASRGRLIEYHRVGELYRMQGTLAGPNAMGLYLMNMLLLYPLWRPRSRLLSCLLLLLGLVAILLTFSRSSLIGLAAGGILSLALCAKKWGIKTAPVFLSGLVLVTTLGLFICAQRTDRYFSDEIRWQQYKRVWEKRGEIGLMGRGPGSAGLVSQYRLDGGSNYYTENTYLDIFEGLGLIGLTAYLLVWAFLLFHLFASEEGEGFWLAIVGVGMLVAGVFITNYTGQAAIWTYMLLVGLFLGRVSVRGNEHRA